MDHQYDEERDETGSLVHECASHGYPFLPWFDSTALIPLRGHHAFIPIALWEVLGNQDNVQNGKARAKPTVNNI
jgi:hypothetical protein